MKIKLSLFKQNLKKTGLLSVFFLLTFQACKKDSISHTPLTYDAESSEIVGVQFADNEWKKQLDKVMSSGNDSLKQSNIKMIAYEYQGRINSKNEVAALKTSILSDKNYIPTCREGVLNRFSITTFQEAKNTSKLIDGQNKAQLSIDLIQKYLDKEVRIGLDIIKINWQANGKSFTSTCLASNDGIIYDNILSNVLLVKVSTTIKFKNVMSSKTATNLTSVSEFDDPNEWTTISWFRRNEMMAYWLWGSERGNAWVEREAIGAKSSANVKSISSYHGNAHDEMTLGSSSSKCVVEEGDPSTGPFGHVKFIWGMYLASPTMDIAMTLKNGTYKFTMTGVGSEAHDSGVDGITPGSLN